MKKLLLLLTGVFTITAMAQWYDFIGQLQFDPASPNPAHQEATTFYDNTAKAVAYFTDVTGVQINLGQQHATRVRNVTGSTILKGSVVYVSGTTGQTPQVTLADAKFYETAFIIGVVMEDLADASFGYVLTEGVLSDYDTSTFTNGDAVYLSDTVAGAVQIAAPSFPSILYKMGTVINSHASQGKLLLAPERISREDHTSRNWLGNSAGLAHANEDFTRFTTGNNILFDGGGTIAGTLELSTTPADLLESGRVFKYTQVSGSLNDWIAHQVINVPANIQNTAMKGSYRFKYKYDGGNGDLETRVKCVDTGDLLIDGTYDSAMLWANSYEAVGTFTIPLGCTQILVGTQVVTENIGAIFLWDRMEVNEQVDSRVNLVEQETITYTGFLSKNVDWVRFKTSILNNSSNLITVQETPETKVIFLKQTAFTASANVSATTSNTDLELFDENDVRIMTSYVDLQSGNFYGTSNSLSGVAEKGWYILVKTGGVPNDSAYTNFSVTATATSEKVSHATDTSDVDSMIRFYEWVGDGTVDTKIWRFDDFMCNTNDAYTPVTLDATVDCGAISCITTLANGTVCTVNENGVYTVSASGYHGGQIHLGVSLNSTQLTTNFQSINVEDRLFHTGNSGQTVSSSNTVKLKKGDVLRVHTDGTNISSNTNRAQFTITKQKSNAGYVVVADAEQNTKSYTPLIEGFGTVTDMDVTYQKVGDTLVLKGIFTAGTTSATEAKVYLPNGYTVKSNATRTEIAGTWIRRQSTTNKGGVVLTVGGNNYINFSANGVFNNSSINPSSEANADTVVPTGVSLTFTAIVPVNELDGSGLVTGKFAKVRTCYLKDKRDNGQAGGTFTAGAWRTRVFDSVTEGDCGFLTRGVLTSSSAMFSDFYFQQFILESGKYNIDCSSIAKRVNGHQSSIYNGTSSTYDIQGTVSYAGSADATLGHSKATGSVDLSVPNSFELRHFSESTRATDGFGDALNTGIGEVYVICKIQQVLAR